MKKTLFFISFLTFATNVFAYDIWKTERFSGGETVFYSGVGNILVVGDRGVGYVRNNLMIAGLLLSDNVVLTIDDFPSMSIKSSNLGNNTLAISDNPDVLKKIANAKKIKIKVDLCVSPFGGCTFTRKGFETIAEWSFETSLAEQFKDYQERIR